MSESLFPTALGSDLGRDVYAPTMALAIDGAPAPAELMASLTEVAVSWERGLPGSFSLSLHDAGTRWVAAGGPLTRGTRVSIDLGYDGQPERVFTGTVRQVSAEFPESGPPVVRIDGFDALHDLTQHSCQAVYSGDRTDRGVADSEVFEQVAARHGVRSQAPASERRQRPRVQANESDFEFLQMLAEACDRDLFADPDGVLRFAPASDDHRPALRLTRGRNLRSFGALRSDVGELDRVEVRAWDPAQKDALVGSATTRGTAAGSPRTFVVEAADVDGRSEADRMAATVLEQRGRGGRSAHGTTLGDPSLTVGRRVEVSGVGQFDGTYVLTHVDHRFGSGGFVTSFQAEEVSQRTGASTRSLGRAGERSPGRRATVPGVVPGLVLEGDDPAELARVWVHVPVLGDDVRVWARVAVPLAGAGTGALWVPRPDDEVLVAFELGDPARPYVVGSLWSAQDPPPGTDQDPRDVLLLRTASGHRLELVDKEGERGISLVDADGNGLVVDTEEGTVTVRAASGVRVAVPDGSFEVDSTSTTVETSQDLEVTSRGSQTFRATGTSTVKGSTVRIN